MGIGRSSGVWGLLLTGLVAGCAYQPSPPPSEIARGQIPPVPRERAPLPELVIPQLKEERRVPEKRYSLSVRNAEIGEVLLAFSARNDLNLIVDPDVTGKVTIDLKEVTLDEALEALLTPLGLAFERRANFIRVRKLQIETRVFTLDYVATVRDGSGSIAAGTRVAGARGGGGSTTTVSTRDRAAVFDQLRAQIPTLLSRGGSFFINEMAGLIMVRDFPESLNRIGEFLERLEGSIQRQVFLQAVIVEVTLSDEFKFGINWSALASIPGTVLRGSLTELRETVRRGQAVTERQGRLLRQTLSPDNRIFQVGVADGDFSLLLDALSTQGQVNILSSPTISTLNNQRAVIRVGREEVFFRTTRERREEGQAEVVTVTPETISVGLTLDVTPQIGSGGDITMNVHPSISEVVRIAVSSTGDTAPVVDVRESQSVVRVRDGQSVVMGGLIQEKKREALTKVPLLGSIPGLGVLFRRTDQAVEKTELVIFLRPTILSGRRIQDLTQEELNRLERARPDFHLGPLLKRP